MSNREKSSNKHSPQAKPGISGSSTHRCGNDSPPAPEHRVQNPYVAPALCVLLFLAVVLIFGQTFRHDFVNFDDNDYVYENPRVAHGLSVQGIAWAFTHFHASNWHPLTWLSHMLDCQLYALAPGGHHLSNVLLHAATAILLFLVLRRMTGDLWPSAFVAAVFAIHPLRVESVAWVSERKDVLSGLFFMLTLWAYAGYVSRPFSLARYLMVMGFFALGLMAKPMLVTLPFVLLLLDYWPLGRMEPTMAENQPISGSMRSSRFSIPLRLAMEKVPLIILSVASCMATLWAQSSAITINEYIALPLRIANAAVSYVAYLGQLFYPAGLAPFYPHPGFILPIWKIVGAILLLTVICISVFALRRRCPYLLVGWLWYMVMLLPVIGLVQVGIQAMADRYTYLTQIGLGIAIAWGIAQLTRLWPYRDWACGIASALVLAVLMGCAWRQTSYWYNRETLWTHTLDCTSQNYVAHNNLGTVLAQSGRLQEAIEHFQQAIQLKADYPEALYNLGLALDKIDQLPEAIECYEQALTLRSDYPEAHYNLGSILSKIGRLTEAIEHFQRALTLKPDYLEVHNNLGSALVEEGRLPEAIEHYKQALQINPNYVDAYNNMGIALMRAGRAQEAIDCIRQALQLKPDLVQARINMGLALTDTGRLPEAIEYYKQALQIKPDYAEAYVNMAGTYAKANRPSEAVAAAQKALDLARSKGQITLVRQIEKWLNSYQAGLSDHPNTSLPAKSATPPP